MGKDIYRKLRGHLDRLPIGTPETKLGVEIEILQELFTPEQAKMALELTAKPESVEEILQRLGKSKDNISPLLQEMEKKGLIWWVEDDGVKKYSIMPLYPGVLEFQVQTMGSRLAKKIEEYLDTVLTKEMVGTDTTHLFRIVPIHKEVPIQMYIHPYEKVAEIIEGADSVYLTECLCRIRKGKMGESCEAPTDVCIVFDNYGKMMAETGNAKPISKKKAMEVLEQAENAGLIHNSLNVEKGNQFVCNCCGCCCAILKGVTKLNIPSAVVKSDFNLEVDFDRCDGCGTCVDRCHLKAVSIKNDKSVLNRDRCVGCGVCIPTCPTKARYLVRKSPEESVPAFPSDEVAFAQLAKDRGRVPPLPTGTQ
jgi:NAD-dependent dihydropyrimidine dehydrogenase PreA subunit